MLEGRIDVKSTATATVTVTVTAATMGTVTATTTATVMLGYPYIYKIINFLISLGFNVNLQKSVLQPKK